MARIRPPAARSWFLTNFLQEARNGQIFAVAGHVKLIGGQNLAKSLGVTFDERVDTVFKSKTETGESNTVEQVAAFVLLLAVPAGRGIAGAQLSIDGGIASY